MTNQFWKWMFLHRGQAILISFMLSDLIIKSGPSRNEWELQLTKQWNFFLYEGLLCHHCFQQVLFMQLVLCTVFYKVLSRACLKSWHHNKQVFDFFSNVKLHWNGYLPLVTHRLKTNVRYSHFELTGWVGDNQTLFSQMNKNKIHNNLQNNISYLGA